MKMTKQTGDLVIPSSSPVAIVPTLALHESSRAIPESEGLRVQDEPNLREQRQRLNIHTMFVPEPQIEGGNWAGRTHQIPLEDCLRLI